MIGLFIAAVAFIVSDSGYFGSDLLFALNVTEHWYWFVLYSLIVVSLVILVFFVFIFKKFGNTIAEEYGGWIDGVFGTLFGSLFVFSIVIKTTIQLFIIDWLTNNINPMALTVGDISIGQFCVILIFIVLAFVPPKLKVERK